MLDRDYTYNPRGYGELVGQSRYFHHYDALGSTDRLTDAAQAAVVSYLYRAFGEQTVLSGSSVNRFGWIGKLGYYRQPDTGDYWVRANIEMPVQGRWKKRDALCALASTVVANCYQYVSNSPLTQVDPSGLQPRRGRRRCGRPCSQITDPEAKPPHHNSVRCDKDKLRTYIKVGCGRREYGSRTINCSGNYYAWTTCCRENGCCVAKIFYCQSYNEAPSCIQFCIRRHEGVHARGCRRRRVITGEGTAYRVDCTCACNQYRGRYGESDIPDECANYPQ